MPLMRLQPIDSSTFLGLWHVTEEPDTLLAQLFTLRPAHEIPEFKAASRTKEWLASRLLVYTLLAELSPAPLLLKKFETGQPYIEGATYQVSITHSGTWVAALISATHEVGIDLEIKGVKAPKLAPRFLSEAEISSANQDSDKFHVYWSAKESLYKLYSRRQLDFRAQILLQNFDKQESGWFEGRILTEEFEQKYAVQYELAPDYVLTYVMNPLKS